jgi:hypothetical protein
LRPNAGHGGEAARTDHRSSGRSGGQTRAVPLCRRDRRHPEVETDFNRWYDREHLPGLASVPGTVRAWRFRNVAGSPRYHACYDIVSPFTVGSPPWIAVRNTAWSQRVRPAFRNTTRTMFIRRARMSVEGIPIGAHALVTPMQKARILAEALPFIRAFHASTLIIRFGGGAMADPALREGFARDVALLRLVGMNPVIVTAAAGGSTIS